VRGLNPVVSLSIKGYVLNALLRTVYAIVHVFLGRAWKRPLKNFEENPATYTRKELLYFGYKYYAYPHTEAETPEQAQHFKTQPYQWVSHHQPESTLSIGGDLMPYKVLMDADSSRLWEEAGSFFDADLVFANLETPMDLSRPPSWVPEVMLSNMYFNGNEALWQVFTNQNKGRFDVLSVANNHMLDQGYEGLEATFEFLSQKGVMAPGGRKEPEFDPSGYLCVRGGITYGFTAWTYSLNTCIPDTTRPWRTNLLPLNVPGADFTPIYREADALRKAGAEVLVISLHGGNAYQAFPQEHVISNYRRIMEQTGAEVIVGTHPHNAQPWEFYRYADLKGSGMKTGLIIYSPGDFIAYDIFKWCHLPCTYKLGFQRTGQGVQLTAFEPQFWYFGLFEGKEIRLIDAHRALESDVWRNWPAKNRKEFLELMNFRERAFPHQSSIFEAS